MSEAIHSPNTVLAETRTANFRDIYSNYMRVGFTPWDVSLAFGLLADDPSNQGRAQIEALIRMSPQQFKSLATAIPLILEQWERQFGTINLPPGMTMSAEMIQDEISRQQAPAAKR